ncbi:MAG: tetratricopeptide repeat protein [Gemmatimonadaceae bacterium]|nr:tetratricopeptide repeat protein [Gemmatimonadaceae bacterium]
MFAVSAGAQAACDIDEGRPSQVARAFLSVTQAANAQEAENWAEATRSLQNAVKLLSERGAIGPNELGRSFLLGKALSLYLNNPTQPLVTDAASLGFPAEAGTIDLVSAVDSLFEVVEQSQPGCLETTADWRRQKGWVGLLQSAADHLNAGRNDSAIVAANRAMTLGESPYATMVLGHVANNQNQLANALRFYERTVELASDSIYTDLRFETLVNIGNLATDAAADTVPEAKAALAQRAATAYQAVMQNTTDSTFVRAARRGLSRSALLMGDTTSFRGVYAPLIANPAGYTYDDLVVSGVDAAQAGLWADAVKLFDGAVERNTWHRDALYNGALSHARQGTHDRALALVQKLVQLDPSNPDNWMLTAEIYNGLAKAAARNPAQQKTMNEAVTANFSKAQDMKHRVAFSEFAKTASGATLGGIIENRSDAARSFTLRVEFLDAAGAVVGTGEAAVGPVAPGAEGRFTITAAAPNVAGFRYAPL